MRADAKFGFLSEPRLSTWALVFTLAIAILVLGTLGYDSYSPDELTALWEMRGRLESAKFMEWGFGAGGSASTCSLANKLLVGLLLSWGWTEEWMQRLPSAILGIFAMGSLWTWQRAFGLRSWSVGLAALILAGSNDFLLYAQQARHYTGDVLFAIAALTWAGRSLQRAPTFPPIRLVILWFAAVALMVAWTPVAAISILCASVCILIRRDGQGWRWDGWAFVIAAWAGLCLISYRWLYLGAVSQEATEFWAQAMGTPQNAGEALQDLATPLKWFTRIHAGAWPAPAVVVGLGLVRLVWTKRWHLLPLGTAPFLATCVLSWLQIYPLSDSRVGLFWLPGWLLLGAAGIEGWVLALPRGRSWIAVATAALITSASFSVVHYLDFIEFGSHCGELLSGVLAEWREGDLLVVDAREVPRMRWYMGPRYDELPKLLIAEDARAPEVVERQLANRPEPATRTWFVLGRGYAQRGAPEFLEYYLAKLPAQAGEGAGDFRAKAGLMVLRVP